MNEPCVYRAYQPDGTLIYVGSAACFELRMEQHSRRSRWYSPDLRWVVDLCATVAESRALERDVIRAEHPRENLKWRKSGVPAVADIDAIDAAAIAEEDAGQRRILDALDGIFSPTRTASAEPRKRFHISPAAGTGPHADALLTPPSPARSMARAAS